MSAPNAVLSHAQLPPGLQLQDQCDEYVFASHANILMAFWKKAPTIASINRLEPHLKRCAAEHKGVGYMAIAFTSKAPDEAREVNSRSSKIIKEIGTVAAAYVFTEEGITGKLVKLSLNLTFMLSGVNQRGFTKVPEASEFLCGELQKASKLTTTPPQVTEAITRMLALLK